MIDIIMPDSAKEYDGYMLMKFTTSYEYQQDFLNGNLFFNTADFFAKCDDEGRGDSDEGNTFIVDYENPNLISANLEKVGDTYAIVVCDYSKTPEDYKRGTIWDYSSAINRRRKIISFYTAFVNIQEQRVAPFDSRMKKEFGEYGILILNRQEFFQRVWKAIYESKKYTQVAMGFLDYIPQDKHQGLIDWNPFLKKEKFAYQNEFRATFVSDDDKPIKIELGCSFRDIAVPIMMKDLKEIHFDNGNLLYPAYSETETEE